MLISNMEKQVLLPEIIDNLGIMVWIKNKENRLIYLNNEAKRNLFHTTKDSDVDPKECPLSCNVSDIVTEKVDVIESVYIDGIERFLKCSKIPLDIGMMVIAEDITNKVADNDKAVKVLNDRIDEWKKQREIKSEKSDIYIQNILDTVRKIKRDKNISDE